MTKIPVVKQRDLKDCGACSLQSIIMYYGGYVPLEKIREDTFTSKNGTTAYHLIMASNSYGFESIGVKVKSIHDKNIYLPAIIHLNLKNGLEHFAVIYKISNNNVWIMDPAKGKTKIAISELLEIWDNILILLSPISQITKMDKNNNIFNFIIRLLNSNKKLFASIIIVNIVFVIISIICNFYFQISVNIVEQEMDIKLLKFIVIIFLILYLFKIIIDYLKKYYLNYLNKNLDIEVFSGFLSHIFHLPLNFIQNRSTGEIVSRVEELNEIKNLFAEIFTCIILNSILIIGAALVLYFINALLFFILCLIISIYVLVGLISGKLIYYKVKKSIDASTYFNTILVENIDMNYSIKNLNLIDKFLYRLEDKLVLMLKNNFFFSKTLNNISCIKDFVYEIGLFIVTTIGIYLIYKGELNVLNLVTFNSLVLYLFEPIKDIIDTIPKYNYLKASFNKLSEFLNISPEKYDTGFKNIDPSNIEVKNLSYSYNKFTYALKNINFKIEAKDKVLLYGPSGCGKSTICKLLCRGLSNYSGVINFSGMSEDNYSLSAIRQNILYVGQNEALFTGSIKENIVCKRDISEEKFIEISKMCQVDKIVEKRPNKYNSIINASLNNLSGGEKQRIILARALLKNVKLIILDEALSEVNENMEKEILKSIFRYFKDITLIYVTHKNVFDIFKKTINIGELK